MVIAYLDALIHKLISKYNADPARIYMTGGSTGGMMTFVYAVSRSERVAAVAPAVASMFTFDKKPSAPFPMLIINSAKDEGVPIEGGMSRNPLVSRAQDAPRNLLIGRYASGRPVPSSLGFGQGFCISLLACFTASFNSFAFEGAIQSFFGLDYLGYIMVCASIVVSSVGWFITRRFLFR